MLNHKYGYRMIAASLLLVGLLVLAGCAASGQKTVGDDAIAADKNVLRVGVTPDAPPLIFKQNGKIVGLEAEFARALADDLGKALQFVELKWKNQIPALLENRIDIIMSGMVIDPIKEVRIAFCDPYFKSALMALIRIGDLNRFSIGFFSLSTNSAIGAIKDTTGARFLKTYFTSVKKEFFSTTRPAVKALLDKKIDMFIYGAPMVFYLASENENNGLTALPFFLAGEDLAWAVRKDNTELLAAANEFTQNPANEKKLKQMIHRWIPFTK